MKRLRRNRLNLINSGKAIVHVARELGLNDATLGIWKRQYRLFPKS